MRSLFKFALRQPMTKKEFRSMIMQPLERAFECEIFFSGERPARIKLRSASVGGCFYEQRIIVIRWSRLFAYTLETLFHEIGHLALHGKEKRACILLEEIEAGAVARTAFEMLGISGEIIRALFGNKERGPSTYSMKYYQMFNTLPEVRWNLVEDAAKQIADACEVLSKEMNVPQYRQMTMFENPPRSNLIL